MKIRCVWEHNGNDSLLYSADHAGAFTRGESKEVALAKMEREIGAYLKWRGGSEPPDCCEIEIVQESESKLDICDADSEVIFDGERAELTQEEYAHLKSLALKSASDFHRLYEAVPDKDRSCLAPRKSFIGEIPRTANEMYAHTRSVNSYYFGEIGIAADNHGNIHECRERGFALLEKTPDFLKKSPCMGSYGEEWSLRKVLRRFIWHDRIHARAMYRMALRTFGAGSVPDIFHFQS